MNAESTAAESTAAGTTAADGVLAYLETLAAIVEETNGGQEARRAGWAYSSCEALVADLGHSWSVEKPTLPAGVKHGEPNRCFNNAFDLAWAEPHYRYVEGYAQASVLPVAHAWVLDTVTGQIIDPTWSQIPWEAYARRRPIGYVGVVFDREFVARATLDNGGYPSVISECWRSSDRPIRVGFRTDAEGFAVDWADAPIARGGTPAHR